MRGPQIEAACPQLGRPVRMFAAGLSQRTARAYFTSLIASLPIWPNGVCHPVADVWTSMWWNEQGRHGWIWYNWGNLHTVSCLPWCKVRGPRGFEWIRAFDSPRQGAAANVLQHLRHLAAAPAAIQAEVDRSIARNTPVPTYSRFARTRWAGNAWSGRVLGLTDRVALHARADGDNVVERIATAAHELGHLVLARHSVVELPGEESYIECLTKQIERGARRPGPIHLNGRLCGG